MIILLKFPFMRKNTAYIRTVLVCWLLEYKFTWW